MFKLAIPVFHVSQSVAAAKFYCEKLGFELRFEYRGDAGLADPCYMGISRDGVCLHLSSLAGDGVSGNVVNIHVDDVDALHAEFVAKDVPIAVGPVDQTWGAREMYVKDADGNSLRFQAEIRKGS